MPLPTIPTDLEGQIKFWQQYGQFPAKRAVQAGMSLSAVASAQLYWQQQPIVWQIQQGMTLGAEANDEFLAAVQALPAPIQEAGAPYIGPNAPASPLDNTLWWDTTVEEIKRWSASQSAWKASGGGGGSGGVLAMTAATAAGGGWAVNPGTSSSDVDPSLVITFTATTSKVIVTLNNLGYGQASVSDIMWGLRDSNGDVANSYYFSATPAGTTTDWRRCVVHIPVTGLTPGQAYTWKWGHKASGAGATAIGTYKGGPFSPGIMIVEGV